MKVLIDGKEVECNESVEVIHEDHLLGERAVEGDPSEKAKFEDWNGQVHIKCTSEGIIVDVVDDHGEVDKSAWQTVDDLVEMTH